jgi:peptidoglycan/LPS O-acetylase OafA/YrhL
LFLRIRSLDSVRGIAALIVVVSHCMLTNRDLPHWCFRFPVSLLNAGDGAVFVFFALSGCVLFLSLAQREKSAYFAYLIKRFFRIYPAFVVAILGSAALRVLVNPHPVPGVSDWFNGHWHSPATGGMLLGHLAMTDLPRLRQLDSVMWSLVHEIRISIIFPVIALLVVTNWRAAVIVSTLISVACALIEAHHPLRWMFDPVQTLSYLFLFTAGAALASHAKPVRRGLQRCPLWLQFGLWIIAARLLTVPSDEDLGLITGAGALLLIALAFGTSTIDRVLATSGILTWLGKVSYSLYLVHFPIIMTCVHLLYARLPLPAIFAFAIVSSLVTAELMYRFIEQPSMALGRRLASLPALQRTFSPHRKFAPSDA